MKPILLVVGAFLVASCGKEQPLQSPSPSMPAFDELWNYDDPAGTEAKFRALLPKIRESGDASYQAELLTQISRSQGLQQKFSDAAATLDQVDALVKPEMKIANVRNLLERGRLLNSSGKKDESFPLFMKAFESAQQADLEFYAIDAAHMLGIVTKGEDSLAWNEKAIALAEAARSERARRWLGSLYNNTGWTYFDMGKYQDALRMFQRDIELRKQKGNNAELGIARWSAAKMLRHLGRVEESLKLQMELLDDPDRKGNDSEGYSHEEVAECLLLLHRDKEATPHFASAWKFLHDDPWLKRDEPARLDRLKKLGHVD